MTCTILIRATDSPSGGMEKGWPSVVRDEPWSWGGMEGLPDWIRLTISDADADQVTEYLASWQIEFDFSIVTQNVNGWRFEVEADPAQISASGIGRDIMKAEMQDWVTESYDEQGAGGTVHSFSVSSMQADVPKTGEGAAADLAKRVELKSRFNDKFKVMFSRVRFRFLEADVDAVVSAGGTVTRTKAQMLAIIKDRYLE